ncbi:MAG: thiosulfate oxidation carrier complex protein SoxZ [Chlorobium sp.]|uniref:thiosulfate oxidation carrier complex protein SoxZ n=1 Tax=Chlorobium sp. TaxID=1095 RepID=UPI0025C03419|nr:thiosulfate oxidation carrier complex protein SoxZ [Chlorobium sp.]MCF8216336.1 thiosulfate oxidation carrier complex protein SoxZ [Chlorobium sp.]MCF8271238.1 thiosulfate oxidation carrier complex protein SoxZ [Chlorobium sp.]MCF8287612.1 thiosulfate oxidation carrier complex protein SoxZ [Chlorobium sp.]MCF8291151.1 thiosulfate oxidation carrier complex protein SoxZ [Chlorobium sp.]MCF8385212.1 thiosulfate oxidation carrier complex protein SoxZ [Chlorobium sp.]
MRILATESGGIVSVKVIIPHPNESGSRKDESGSIVPANFVKEGMVMLNGKPLLELQLGPSVSKNPFFQFKFAGKKGDKLSLRFLDSSNQEYSAEAAVV